MPRRFGDLETEVPPLGFSATERRLCMFDGGSERDLLEAVPEHERSDAQPRRKPYRLWTRKSGAAPVFPYARQLDQYCRQQTTPLARESQSTAKQSRSLRLGSTHRTGATVL